MQLNQQLVNGLITHPEIISASIIDAKGSELALASKEKTCVPSNISIMLHGSNNQYEYALEFRDINLGKLVLELDTCKKTEQFFPGCFQFRFVKPRTQHQHCILYLHRILSSCQPSPDPAGKPSE